MRRFVLSILVAVSLVCFVKAQETTAKRADAAKEVEKEILKLELEKTEVLKKSGSVAADWFDRYFTDDVDYIGSSGSVVTKAQSVDGFRSGEFKLLSVQHDDYRVRVYGNTAIATYRGNDIGERNGKVGKRQLVLTTDVFVKQDGMWRFVVHHVTPVRTQ
jgi:ketosteroid isomerase-like protein